MKVPRPRHIMRMKVYANSKQEFIDKLQDFITTIDAEKGDNYLDHISTCQNGVIMHTEEFNEDMNKEKYLEATKKYRLFKKELKNETEVIGDSTN